MLRKGQRSRVAWAQDDRSSTRVANKKADATLSIVVLEWSKSNASLSRNLPRGAAFTPPPRCPGRKTLKRPEGRVPSHRHDSLLVRRPETNTELAARSKIRASPHVGTRRAEFPRKKTACCGPGPLTGPFFNGLLALASGLDSGCQHTPVVSSDRKSTRLN